MRLLVGMVAAAALVACASGEDPAAETEVAGLVLEREAERPLDEDPERPPDLNLLRSGPTRSGTLWVLAAGQWVGLDSQSLEAGELPSPVHLDAIVLETTLAPGSQRSLQVGRAPGVDLDVDRDRQVHGEGRFDRT